MVRVLVHNARRAENFYTRAAKEGEFFVRVNAASGELGIVEALQVDWGSCGGSVWRASSATPSAGVGWRIDDAMILAQQVLLVDGDACLAEKVLALDAERHIVTAAHCTLVGLWLQGREACNVRW